MFLSELPSSIIVILCSVYFLKPFFDRIQIIDVQKWQQNTELLTVLMLSKDGFKRSF